ncbi:MAG: hypothetical protein HOZ81_05040 [Streptomyces sp.]|nr:hypothetical protein [Streptomyces sp.]
MTDQTADLREPDHPAAYALARHIADHPVSTIQAAFRYLNAPLTIELHEDTAAGVAPAADQTPCGPVPDQCDDEPCAAHEREQAHAEGEHAFCGPECAATDPELTAEEARDLADDLGTQLYRAQDALAFVAECCTIAERDGRTITTADVREWLKGARCGRRLAADATDQTERRDRYAAAVRQAGDTAYGNRPFNDAITDAVMAVADAEQAELQAEVKRLEEQGRRLLEQRQEMAEERYVWQQRGDRAERRAEAMERGMESTVADALKHRGCHRDLMAQCLRAERAEARVAELEKPAAVLAVDRADVLREVADICDEAGASYAAKELNDQAGVAFALMERFQRKADEAEYVATPCDPMVPCEDGGEPCRIHERLMAHAEGEHELCEPDCGLHPAAAAFPDTSRAAVLREAADHLTGEGRAREDAAWSDREAELARGWQDAAHELRRLADGEQQAEEAKPEPTAPPVCEGFVWIGQSFATCDRCSQPAWDHTGEEVPVEGAAPFDNRRTVRPWEPGQADRIRDKWEPQS